MSTCAADWQEGWRRVSAVYESMRVCESANLCARSRSRSRSAFCREVVGRSWVGRGSAAGDNVKDIIESTRDRVTRSGVRRTENPLLEPPCSSARARIRRLAHSQQMEAPPTTWPALRSLRESFIPERHIDIHSFIHIQGEKEAPAARELRTKTPW